MKISLKAAYQVINSLSLSQVSTLVDLDPSTISYYRNGRDIADNLLLPKVAKLTSQYNETHTAADDEIEYDVNELDFFKANFLSIRPILSKRLVLFGEKGLTIPEVARLNKILNKDILTWFEYGLVLKVNKLMRLVLSLDEDKILQNFERLIESSGKTKTALALSVNRPSNYLSSIVSRHKSGVVFISDLSETTFVQLTKVFYGEKEETTTRLKQELLK